MWLNRFLTLLFSILLGVSCAQVDLVDKILNYRESAIDTSECANGQLFSFEDDFSSGIGKWDVDYSYCDATITTQSGTVKFSPPGEKCSLSITLPDSCNVKHFEYVVQREITSGIGWAFFDTFAEGSTSSYSPIRIKQDAGTAENFQYRPDNSVAYTGATRLNNIDPNTDAFYYWKVRYENGVGTVSISTDGTNYLDEWTATFTYIGTINLFRLNAQQSVTTTLDYVSFRQLP